MGRRGRAQAGGAGLEQLPSPPFARRVAVRQGSAVQGRAQGRGAGYRDPPLPGNRRWAGLEPRKQWGGSGLALDPWAVGAKTKPVKGLGALGRGGVGEGKLGLGPRTEWGPGRSSAPCAREAPVGLGGLRD